MKEGVHGCQEFIERELSHRDVERRQTELAGERAPARGFDVEDTVGDVFVRVEVVGEREVGQRWDRCVDEGGGDKERGSGGERNGIGVWLQSPSLPFSLSPPQQLPAQRREPQIGLARDDVIGEPRDLLLIGLVTDFGSAEDHDHFGSDSLQVGHQSSRLIHVPDVNAQPHHARPLR